MKETAMSQYSNTEPFKLIKSNLLGSVTDVRTVSDQDICFDIIIRVYHWFKNNEDIYEKEEFKSSVNDGDVIKSYNRFLYDLNIATMNTVTRFDPASKYRMFVHSELKYKYTKLACMSMIKRCEYMYEHISKHVNTLLDKVNVSDERKSHITNQLNSIQININKLKFVYNYNE